MTKCILRVLFSLELSSPVRATLYQLKSTFSYLLLPMKINSNKICTEKIIFVLFISDLHEGNVMRMRREQREKCFLADLSGCYICRAINSLSFLLLVPILRFVLS